MLRCCYKLSKLEAGSSNPCSANSRAIRYDQAPGVKLADVWLSLRTMPPVMTPGLQKGALLLADGDFWPLRNAEGVVPRSRARRRSRKTLRAFQTPKAAPDSAWPTGRGREALAAFGPARQPRRGSFGTQTCSACRDRSILRPDWTLQAAKPLKKGR